MEADIRKSSLTLRNIPVEVKKILLRRQGELKAKCDCQVSLENTIYRTIREWHEMKTVVKK